MLDIRRYILENFTSSELQMHLEYDVGGFSVDYLQSILEPGSKIAYTSMDIISASFIKQFGPILVFQFQVYEDFQLAGGLSYLEEPSGKFIGRHAMVLVGVRMELAQKIFLLQNWWKKKQFVEVSERYMDACNGRFAFVRTQQTGVPSVFQTGCLIYAESAGLDKVARG